MVLHPRSDVFVIPARSTGVEIQVVLHPSGEIGWTSLGSTGVEIQVVLHLKVKALLLED